MEQLNGDAVAPEKKSRKALPSVDAASVSSAGVDTEAAKPLVDEPAFAPVAVDYDAELQKLNAALGKTTQLARLGLGVAAVALVLAFSSPWWVPRMFDNDLATRQSGVLAATQLRLLANHDQPFAAEMALLARALPTDKVTVEAIATMEPLARTGAPTLIDLKDSFQGIAAQVLVGQMVTKDDQSWVSWGLHKVAGLIRADTIAGTVSTAPADVRTVQDAEESLTAGDLAKAVDELSKLEGNSANEVQDWLDRAKSRLALDRAVADITQIAESRASRRAWLR